MGESRQQMLALAAAVVEKAAKDGGIVAARREALRLALEHPGCPMTVEDLSSAIATLAVERGLAVEFEDPDEQINAL